MHDNGHMTYRYNFVKPASLRIFVPLTRHAIRWYLFPMKMRRPTTGISNLKTAPNMLREAGLKAMGQAHEEVAGKETEEKEPRKHRFIRCKQCRQIITTASSRINVRGSYRHTFANPYGAVFDIECFRHAEGLVYMGPFSAEFTWFRGFRWQAAACAMCLTHLGWRFQSDNAGGFYGLILERLIEN